MKTIEDIFKPYNFSETRCYVIALQVEKNGFLKIEHKIPSYVKELKGIFVSTNCTTNPTHLDGLISLNFNGQSFKSYQSFIYKINHLDDCSHPQPFDDTLLPNSFMQGFYYDLTQTKTYPYTLSIYLHYQNKEYKTL